MKAYINGSLSKEHEGCFLPYVIWFATEDNIEKIVSEKCICLDVLRNIKGTPPEGKEFSCEWDGMIVSYVDDNGERIEAELLNIKQLTDIIEKNNMRFIGVYVHTHIDTTIETCTFKLEENPEYTFETNLKNSVEVHAVL